MKAFLLTLSLTCNQTQFFQEEWAINQDDQKLVSSLPTFESRVKALEKNCTQDQLQGQFCEEIYPLLSDRSDILSYLLSDGSIDDDRFGNLMVPIGNVFEFFLNTCDQ